MRTVDKTDTHIQDIKVLDPLMAYVEGRGGAANILKWSGVSCGVFG